jgi:hypothetical protein
MKTCECLGGEPPYQEHTEGKCLRDEDPHIENVLEMKNCTPSEADETCYRSIRRSQRLEIKMSERLRRLELEASVIGTCIG